MKKLFYIIALVAGAIIPIKCIYPTTLKVIKEDYQADTLTLETSSGIIYEMTGVEDYDVGDLVSVMMFNAGTPKNIGDDWILVAHYTGF